MGGSSDSGDRRWLWRSRWAAIGAAVAVTLGGGGVFWAHADSDVARSDFEALVASRRAEPASGQSVSRSTAARSAHLDVDASTTRADVAALTTGSTFVPITPYRTYDSRLFSDGLLLYNFVDTIDVTTDQYGKPKIPATAVAVTYNVTVTGTIGAGGYLALYPAGRPWPGNSSVNWFTGALDLSNGGVVALESGRINVLCGDVFQTATDYIVDITGYYV